MWPRRLQDSLVVFLSPPLDVRVDIFGQFSGQPATEGRKEKTGWKGGVYVSKKKEKEEECQEDGNQWAIRKEDW